MPVRARRAALAQPREQVTPVHPSAARCSPGHPARARIGPANGRGGCHRVPRAASSTPSRRAVVRDTRSTSGVPSPRLRTRCRRSRRRRRPPGSSAPPRRRANSAPMASRSLAQSTRSECHACRRDGSPIAAVGDGQVRNGDGRHRDPVATSGFAHSCGALGTLWDRVGTDHPNDGAVTQPSKVIDGDAAPSTSSMATEQWSPSLCRSTSTTGNRSDSIRRSASDDPAGVMSTPAGRSSRIVRRYRGSRPGRRRCWRS